MDSTRLLAFCGSFFLIALSPGLCMTLSMSLGISIGVRRTLWMMLGEVAGIALVGAAAMAGVAALLVGAPQVFTAFKLAGAAYLLWTAWQAWNAPVAATAVVPRLTRSALCAQGFITAVSNPKAWAFNAALLPPFIDTQAPLGPQMAVLLALMVTIELVCLLIYAQGGRTLSELLVRHGQGRLLNRISAVLMAGVALWLVLAPAAAADAPKVQGKFEREGKTYELTHAVAWQAARPDTLVVIFSDAEVALMDARHVTQLQLLAEGGKLHGLRFEFDPARLDPRWVSGRYMTPDWGTYRGGMGTSWQKLEVAGGRIAGKLDAGGAQVEFDIPIVGAVKPQVLTGPDALRSPQVDVLLKYETAVRKGNWKEASKYLTPLSAEALARDVSTPHGLGQFQTAGKYMREFIPLDMSQRLVKQVVIGAEDSAIVADGFATDFVLIDGRWLKI